ncbi:MAG: multiheme c-type cytochrome [Phycisphaerales bacterium]
MSTASRSSHVIAWAIGPAFAALAAWFALASPNADIPVGEMRIVPRDQIVAGAWRHPLTDAAKAKVGSMNHACSECHKLFGTSPVEGRTLVQHKDIVMNHGMNTRCLNCHDGEDRDKLVLHDGTLVGFDSAPRLCSQCHGTVYRDWERGMHGKTLGSWDVTNPEHYRLTCNECHDPHAPAYQTMAPLPGPDTLRMGDQTRRHEEARKRSPLRMWSTPHDAPHAPESDEHKEGDR